MRIKRILLAMLCGLVTTALVQQFAFNAVWSLADQFSTADWQNWHFVFAVITLPGLCVTALIAGGGRQPTATGTL